MTPEEFTSFEDEKPDEHKWIVVTNNLNAKNAFGEMSHVWMTDFYTKGSKDYEGLVTFDEGGRKVIGLSHWKYV